MTIEISNRHRLLFFTAIILFFGSQTVFADDKPKRILKNNMTEVYHVLPEKADSFMEIFSQSMFYGRVRAHYMKVDRTDENNSKTVEINGEPVQGIDPTGFAIGGSLIHKTAPFHGLSTTLGFYSAHHMNVVDEEDVAGGKAPKDTYSREKYIDEDGNTRYEPQSMNVLAQAYLQLSFGNTDIKGGRQIFESFLTASNDTKMIPNTFSGVSIENRDIPDTLIKAGLFSKQKLRHHIKFHDVMLVDGWNHNDDSGRHLRYTPENGGSNKNDLFVLGITNKSIKNLKLDFCFTSVSGLQHSAMYEANYTLKLSDDLSIIPGFRYLYQNDRGIDHITLKGLSPTEINALNYDAKITGTADATLGAARVVIKYKKHKLTLGCHKNSQHGDVIAPWRGYPTGGYTRTMTELNWSAGTASEMIKWGWVVNKSFRLVLEYSNNHRPGRNTDTQAYHGDFWYKLNENIEIKLRLMNHEGWGDSDFYDGRLECNYLF